MYMFKMIDVFRQRFPGAETMAADFVDFARDLTQRRLTPPTESDGEDGAGGTAAAPPPAVGTIVFNAVFGNMWDHQTVLKSAADILEVWRAVDNPYASHSRTLRGVIPTRS